MDAVDMEIDVPQESRGDSSSNDVGIPEAERSAKRPRLADENEGENDDGSPQESVELLPPEVWARVMEHLPFETVLACGATSIGILKNAMPLLTTLHIDKSSQMNLAVLSRFRDIKTIHINTLLNATVGDGIDIYLTQEPLIRAVPFLSRITSLERVIFNINDDVGNAVMNFPIATNGYFYAGDEQYPDEGSRESMLAFLDHLSGAYRCGAFAKKLRISGICCPDTNNADRRSADCETCLRACESFPLKDVAEFECRGSSENNARSGRTYGLDVCLERAQIESIIESREGGHELLRSSDRLMRLLSCGRMYRIASDDGGKVLHIVKYKTGQIEEIKRVIEYAELDVKKLSVQEVHDAITNSFDRDGSSSTAKRYLSSVSLDTLKDEIGLPIVKDEYVVPLVELVEYTPHLIHVLRHRYQSSIGEDISHDTLEYIDIEVDCLKLLHRFISEQNIPPIQQMANVISCLAKCLQSGSSSHKREAAMVFKIILDKGTNVQKQMIMDHPTVVTSLSLLLDSDADSLAKLALNVLADIFTSGTAAHVTQLLVRAGPIRKLVDLLSSKDDDRIKSSLLVLEVVSRGVKGNVVALSNARAVTTLIELLDSKRNDSDIDSDVSDPDAELEEHLVKSSLRILLGLKDHVTAGVPTASLHCLVSTLIAVAQDRFKSDSLAACTILLRKIFQDSPRLLSTTDSPFVLPPSAIYDASKGTYDELLTIMKVTKRNKVEASVQENMAHAITHLLAESKEQAWVIMRREGFFSSGVVQSLGQLLGSSAAEDKVILLALSNIVLQKGFNCLLRCCGVSWCNSCDFKRLLAAANPIPELNSNLASSDDCAVNTLTVLVSLQDHIGLKHHAMLIPSLLHLMDTSSSKVLGDIAKGSNIGSINIGSANRSVVNVLRSLPTSHTKKPQSIRFQFGLAPVGSKLLLCWVGSNGKLHHHYSYSGSRPLDHTERTHTGDAFVICSVPLLKANPQTKSMLNDSAYKVLCSYRVEKAVDENLYRHDIKWTPEECVVSCAPKDGIDQRDLIYNCSILLHKIYESRCQLITQLDDPSRLVRITKTVNRPEFQMHVSNAYSSNILNIQSNLSLAVVSITARLTIEDTKVVQDASILPLLVNFIVSQDDNLSNKALSAVSHVVSLAPAYQDMILQAGIMRLLMILLMNPQTKRSKLKLVLMAYARCCQGKPHVVLNCKPVLSTLSRILFIQYDEEILGNACCALYNILNGMEQDQVERIDLGFIEHLLKMLPNIPPKVQLTALKTLHLLANTGQMCIKAIIDHNGMVCLCKMLFSQCETSHKLAFDAIRCIISANKKHMQTAIDNGLVQYLCQMLASEQNKEESMQTINTILSSGCDSQIKSLLDQVN